MRSKAPKHLEGLAAVGPIADMGTLSRVPRSHVNVEILLGLRSVVTAWNRALERTLSSAVLEKSMVFHAFGSGGRVSAGMMKTLEWLLARMATNVRRQVCARLPHVRAPSHCARHRVPSYAVLLRLVEIDGTASWSSVGAVRDIAGEAIVLGVLRPDMIGQNLALRKRSTTSFPIAVPRPLTSMNGAHMDISPRFRHEAPRAAELFTGKRSLSIDLRTEFKSSSSHDLGEPSNAGPGSEGARSTAERGQERN